MSKSTHNPAKTAFRSRHYLAYALVLLWMAVIFLFSHQPATVSSQQSGFFVAILDSFVPSVDGQFLTFLTRKSAHFISYFILGALMYNAVRFHTLPLKKTVCISAGIVLSYAISDEIHQLFVAGRSGEVGDVLLDTTAGMVGIGVYAWLRTRTTFSRRTLPKLLVVITTILATLALASFYSTGIMPTVWLVIAGALGGVGLWVILRPLWRNDLSVKRAIVHWIFALVISAISIGILSFSASIVQFLDHIQADAQATETYSIVAVTARSLTPDRAATAGLIVTDPYFKASQTELKAHTHATTREFPIVAIAMNELTANTLDVAVLNSANLQLARDTDEHFDSTFTVIGTFTIRVPNSIAAPSQVNANQPFAVYISGIDTYGNISTVSRSDVNILAIVNPAKRHLVLINTPRDYYVQLHGTIGSKDKLTHAGIYGVDMSRQTLEDLYDIDIPYYIRVNFSSLMAIVDTIGGVSVYSDYAFGQFHVGRNELNGKQALQFSRERYSFTEGDRQRGRNQQRVIEAIVTKLSSPSVLVNYSSILSTTQSALQTNLPPQLITGLVNTQLASPKQWITRSISVDGTGSMSPTYSMGAQLLYVMVPNEASLEQARQEAKSLLQ